MTKKTTILTLLSTIALSAPALSHTANDPGHQLPVVQAPQATHDSAVLPGEDYFLNKIFREAKSDGSADKGDGGGDDGNDRGNGNGNGDGKGKGKGKGNDKGKGDEDGKGHDHNGYSFLGNSLIS